jgi:phosphoglycolate phosphatase
MNKNPKSPAFIIKARAFLFDLDGTLIDSVADLTEAANAVRRFVKLKELDQAAVSAMVGEGLEKLIERLSEQKFANRQAQLVKYFKDFYSDHCLDKTLLYPGVLNFLEKLANQGIKMAVVTNKPEKISKQIIKGLNIDKYFGCILGGNSLPQKKPAPEPLWEACRRLGVLSGQTIMVGDSSVDIIAAKRAGIFSVGISKGLGNQQDLFNASPDLIISNFSDLSIS